MIIDDILPFIYHPGIFFDFMYSDSSFDKFLSFLMPLKFQINAR